MYKREGKIKITKILFISFFFKKKQIEVIHKSVKKLNPKTPKYEAIEINS